MEFINIGLPSSYVKVKPPNATRRSMLRDYGSSYLSMSDLKFLVADGFPMQATSRSFQDAKKLKLSPVAPPEG